MVVRLLITLVCIAANFSVVFAQEGRYNLRMVHESYDCITKKGILRLEIKADGSSNTFRMGFGTIRFSYDSLQINNLVIKEQLNFSSTAPASDTDYAPQTRVVQKGSPSIFTLNIFHASGTGKLVGLEWIPIARLEFDLVSADGCYTTAFRTASDFPPTGMNEVDALQTYPDVVPGTQNLPFTSVSTCLGGEPTAIISGSTTINSGEQATLEINFTGSVPISIMVDGTTYNNLTISPLFITVFPNETTTYEISSVSNDCGTGTASGSATITVAPTPAPTISAPSLASTTICQGSPMSISFTTTGSFGAGNQFQVQLINSQGQNTVLGSGSSSPIAASLPNDVAGTGFRLRVVATNPAVQGAESVPFTIVARPTATLSGSTTVQSGQSATLTVTFTGAPPFSVALSDGQTRTNITTTTTSFTVSPTTTTQYTLSSVSNSCGTGTASGSATITVAPTPAPTISAPSLASTTICQGSPMSISFTTTGSFGAGNQFQVQLINSQGQNTVLGSGSSSPIAASLPNDVAGTGFRLRVVATNPAVQGAESVPFTIVARPTATLSGSTTVQSGQSATLTVTFTGAPPFSVALSDGQTRTNITTTTTSFTVSPTTTTQYTLSSVSNSCGTGTASGSATVTVGSAQPCSPKPICVSVNVRYITLRN